MEHQDLRVPEETVWLDPQALRVPLAPQGEASKAGKETLDLLVLPGLQDPDCLEHTGPLSLSVYLALQVHPGPQDNHPG